MFELWNLELVGRLLLAGFCGLLIGYERQKRSKVAGVRTHCVVACASALMMILSKYAYLDVTEMYGDLMKIDPSRIAAGVVSGIGFLGAGMIFMNKKTTTGLTTAAGIWATAGVGMTVGAGMYFVGLAAALIILLIQVVFHLNSWHAAKARIRANADQPKRKPINMSAVTAKLENMGVEIIETSKDEDYDEDDRIVYSFKAVLPKEIEKKEDPTHDLKAEHTV